MIHIRQPFLSVASAVIFGALGLLYGLDAARNAQVVIGGYELSIGAVWALTGTLFLMAYFSLVHMRD